MIASIKDGEDRVLSGCEGDGTGTGIGASADDDEAAEVAALGVVAVYDPELDTAALERGIGSIRLVQITSDMSHRVDLIIHSPACVLFSDMKLVVLKRCSNRRLCRDTLVEQAAMPLLYKICLEKDVRTCRECKIILLLILLPFSRIRQLMGK
ncbi:hypothetical protein GC093_32365 [Paenibacillus sp. LMG 31456]|uniref:Uncharacterized protein n=1 Tax=Paenibacillus foliorum TaxID=2654974 RepID=A0A972GVW8_9BACL|nr:hypothetical protein [Paenibacillus foliorum]NOU97886.1 hypothetical protein [Paenibacillus foliorum]